MVLIVLADKRRAHLSLRRKSGYGKSHEAAHALGVSSCWIHRAKEEFESPEGKALLKELGIEGDYEGIGHCILGYAADGEPEAKPRKEHYVYYVE